MNNILIWIDLIVVIITQIVVIIGIGIIIHYQKKKIGMLNTEIKTIKDIMGSMKMSYGIMKPKRFKEYVSVMEETIEAKSKKEIEAMKKEIESKSKLDVDYVIDISMDLYMDLYHICILLLILIPPNFREEWIKKMVKENRNKESLIKTMRKLSEKGY